MDDEEIPLYEKCLQYNLEMFHILAQDYSDDFEPKRAIELFIQALKKSVETHEEDKEYLMKIWRTYQLGDD